MTTHGPQTHCSSPVPGWIDIHAHVIPGVDDGPKTFERSLAMLAAAWADGTKTIVATPHVNSTFCTYSDLDDLIRIREEFSGSLPESSGLPRVLFGAEVYLSAEVPDLLNRYRALLTLNGGDYLLVEFPLDYIFPRSRDLFYSLMQEGITPVIAHPERNEMVQRNPGILYDFVEMGTLCQVDAGSLTGNFGPDAQSAALRLISEHAVHLVASDAHDMEDRPASLTRAAAVLDRFGSDTSELLLRQSPLAVINNEAPPDIGPLGRIPEEGGFLKKVRGWFT